MSVELFREAWAATNSDKCTSHPYHLFYGTLFAGRREQVSKVIEAGVLYGGSLNGWATYFPYAEVHGIDTFDGDASFEQARRNCEGYPVRIHVGDSQTYQSSEFQGADLIVDDVGPNSPAKQLATWRNLSRYLAPGGLYVIEDVRGRRKIRALRQRGFVLTDLRGVAGCPTDVLAWYYRPKE